MINIKQNLTLPNLRLAKSSSDSPLRIVYTPVDVTVTEASTQLIQDGDATFNDVVASSYYRAGHIGIEGAVGSIAIEDKTPLIGVTDSDGTITKVSDGIAVFSATQNGITVEQRVNLHNLSNGEVLVRTLDAVVAGSLSEHLSQQVDSRINDTMTMALNGKVYSSQNHTTKSYTRNLDFWGGDIDMTCSSPWNSNLSNRKAGTAITPRHILGAAHYEFGVGTVVRFVTADNQVVERTVVSKKRHPDYQPYSPDLTIYGLDQDLPTTISPCVLFPASYGDFLTVSNMKELRAGAFGLDQEEKGLLVDLVSNRSFYYPNNATRSIFSESKISGDSGNPAFIIVNGELVLITVWTFGGAGSGTALSDNIPALNQMIIDSDAQTGITTVDDTNWPNAGGHYQVKEADFSAFPTYV
tara:strand:- start:15572 stop:16804 length:1233 start_codon:yes stop_codon:yes gene_type:complete